MTEGGDIPRYEIAEQALRKIGSLLDEWSGSDWLTTRPAQEVQWIVDIAGAHLRMAGMRRDRRRPTWFAKVVTGVYGRGFMRPGEFGDDPDPHLCFTVEITDGSKSAQSKRVEVQGSDSDMELLAMQILSMVGLRKEMKTKKEEEGR